MSLVEDTNVTDAQIVVLIGQAMSEISLAADWPFLQTSTTISAVDSQRPYALPSGFVKGVALVDDDYDENLEYVTPKVFFARYGNDTGNESTRPSHFTVWGTNILLHPIPTSNDTNRYSIYYITDITALSSGSTSPQFHAGFHWMLVEYCLWKLYEREEYYDQSERAFITYSRYLEDMKSFYGTRFRRSPYLWGDGDDPQGNVENIANLAIP